MKHKQIQKCAVRWRLCMQAATAESVVEYAEAGALGLQVQMLPESIDILGLLHAASILLPCFLLEGSLS